MCPATRPTTSRTAAGERYAVGRTSVAGSGAPSPEARPARSTRLGEDAAGRRPGRSGWPRRGHRGGRGPAPGGPARSGRRGRTRRRSAGRVSSCASSTTTSRSDQRSASRAPGSVEEEVGRGPEDPRRVERPRRRQRGDLVVLAEDLGGGDPLGPVVLAPPSRASSAASSPSSTARMSRSRSSARKARVGRASSTRSGQGGRGLMPVGVSGEEVPEDDVLLGAAEQARRRCRRAGPPPGAGCRSRATAGVRASGSVEVPPSRAVTRSRSAAAATRGGRGGGTGRPSPRPRPTRSATASTATVVLPVPGAPRTRSTPPRWPTTARCTGVEGGAAASAASGARRGRARRDSITGRRHRGVPGRSTGPGRGRPGRPPSDRRPTSGVPSSR